jgi:hypothetical protein
LRSRGTLRPERISSNKKAEDGVSQVRKKIMRKRMKTKSEEWEGGQK